MIPALSRRFQYTLCLTPLFELAFAPWLQFAVTLKVNGYGTKVDEESVFDCLFWLLKNYGKSTRRTHKKCREDDECVVMNHDVIMMIISESFLAFV